jgi:hypothetical protein
MARQRRIAERIELSLPVRVQCHETFDLEWIESTQLIDVSPFGAKFWLNHPTEPGRLLLLTMRLPRHLRCFDKNELDYRVWALVRYLRTFTSEESSTHRFEVGVAFIGKEPPTSYKMDPTILYELRPVPAKDGQWVAREKPRKTFLTMSADDLREEPWLPLHYKIIVETLDENGMPAKHEESETENISHRGTAILTNFEVSRGQFVKITSVEHQLGILAVVRACRKNEDGRNRLHLEFVDKEWPLQT